MTEKKIPMGRPSIITEEKFKKALKGSLGGYTVLAKKIGVTRQAIYNFVEKHNLRHLVDERREKLVDDAEDVIAEKVKAKDWKAVDKVLSTLGKNRGWVERHEHDHKSENVTVIFEVGDGYPDIKPKEVKKDE